MPSRNDATAASKASFWMIVIGFWAMMFVVAATLALALAIWHLIGAF